MSFLMSHLIIPKNTPLFGVSSKSKLLYVHISFFLDILLLLLLLFYYLRIFFSRNIIK